VKKLLFSLFPVFFLSFFSFGQKNIVFFQKNGLGFPEDVEKILESRSTNQVNKSVQLVRSECIEKGYFLCDIQLSQTSDICDSFLVNIGNQYIGLNLLLNDSVEKVLQRIYPSQRSILKQTQGMGPAQYLRFMNDVLNFHLEHGFPFCRIYLKQVKTREKVIEAELVVNQGPYYVWSEIHLKNDLPVSKNTLQSIIGVRLNDEYNETLFNTIEQRVRQTGIFALKKKCEVLFTSKGAELFVYLERVKSSSAQGIIGFQPNPVTNALTFTGDMQLKLINSVKHNESFQFAWKSIQPRTQTLQSSLIVPYLFKLPFGVVGDFQLYKRDSSFLDVKSSLGVQFQFQNGWQLRANYYFINSSVISEMNANPMFSKLANLKTNSYGLVLFQRKLDYIPNPRKGFSVFIEGQLGERKMEQNSESIWKSQASISYFFPLAERMTLLTNLELDTYHAPSIYQNELYRFGGTNSLRGFNEESIFATTKAILTFEYRFLLDRNSAIFAFFNQGFYENTSVNYVKDQPYGFGFGISAGTNLGIFRLAYALGKEFTNPIQLNAGKIHIGYISYF
jgi:outer membrane translocation and assembly module TamA